MAGIFEIKSNGKAIAIGCTGQQLSPSAGSALFWGRLRRLDWRKTLAAALPQPLADLEQQAAADEKGVARGPRHGARVVSSVHCPPIMRRRRSLKWSFRQAIRHWVYSSTRCRAAARPDKY